MSDEAERRNQRSQELHDEYRRLLAEGPADETEEAAASHARRLKGVADGWIETQDLYRVAALYVRRLKVPQFLAEEERQEVGLHLVQTVPRALSQTGPPGAYMARTARNKVIDRIRGRIRREPYEGWSGLDDDVSEESHFSGRRPFDEDPSPGLYLTQRIHEYRALWSNGDRKCPFHKPSLMRAAWHDRIVLALAALVTHAEGLADLRQTLVDEAQVADPHLKKEAAQTAAGRQVGCRFWIGYDVFVGRRDERLEHEFVEVQSSSSSTSPRQLFEDEIRERLALQADGSWDNAKSPKTGMVYLWQYYPELFDHLDPQALSIALPFTAGAQT